VHDSSRTSIPVEREDETGDQAHPKQRLTGREISSDFEKICAQTSGKQGASLRDWLLP
jgi:hypothetical protein